MTKLTNEQLVDFYEVSLVGDERDEVRAELLRRLAEGAAGEASPQGDLLAALKAILEIAQTSERGKKASAVDRIEVLAEAVIAESGSASTAGPRAKKADDPATCNYAVIRSAIMHEDAGDRKAYCCEDCATEFSPTAGPHPRCPKCGGDELSIANGTIACSCWTCDYQADFSSFVAQFFAAAPAEDAKEKV